MWPEAGAYAISMTVSELRETQSFYRVAYSAPTKYDPTNFDLIVDALSASKSELRAI